MNNFIDRYQNNLAVLSFFVGILSFILLVLNGYFGGEIPNVNQLIVYASSAAFICFILIGFTILGAVSGNRIIATLGIFLSVITWYIMLFVTAKAMSLNFFGILSEFSVSTVFDFIGFLIFNQLWIALILTLVLTISGYNSQILQSRASGYEKPSGYGSISIENGSGHRANVILTYNNSKEIVQQVFISAGNRGVLSGIRDGSYNLFFAFFDEHQHVIARQRFETTLNFYTSPTERGIQYAKYNVTLTPVAGGNARTTSVPERDFPL